MSPVHWSCSSARRSASRPSSTRKALTFSRSLGRPVASEAENAMSLTLESGSRIVSLPGSEGTVRGFSGVRLIFVNEAARVPDELYAAVRPMLAVSGGRLIAMSTPWGLRGWWATAWHDEPGWDRVLITADQVSRIAPAFLEEERRALGSFIFEQEYMCRFADAVEALFGTELIRAATTPDVAPLFRSRPSQDPYHGPNDQGHDRDHDQQLDRTDGWHAASIAEVRKWT
jgi:hypothetical protein